MLDTKEKREISAGMLRVWIIWIAMFISLIFMVVIALALRNSSEVYDRPTVRMLSYILYGVTLVGLVLAYLIRRTMLQRAASKPISGDTYTHNPIPTSAYVVRYTPAVIVSLAIAESIGTFGLTIYFLSHDFRTFVTFLVVSAFALFLFRPKSEEVERLAVTIKQRFDVKRETR